MLLYVLLSACGGKTMVSVKDDSRGLRHPEATYRIVRAGDTLYSIAWESGRDYRELSSWNNIPPPYLIRPGQKLRLFPPRSTADAGPGGYRIVAKGDTLYNIARETGIGYRDLAAWNNIPPPYVIRSGQKLRLSRPDRYSRTSRYKTTRKNTTRRAKRPSAKRAPAKPAATRAVGPWAWPTKGKILASFNANGPNKGIDIGGRKGQAIRAAARGTVVYQGSGLRGYGKLIIIKHNADFLSAYAHSNRIYVKEGNMVKRGQKIAEMGSSGTDRVKLHFEIRRRGIPVNPLKYLPRK
ncbi:MAG: peptidoglycan DD-metalloendopeptidase family protein [Gammaproteobacteria bacterium]|nr:MAG: peptidoglycan DD-metalloendopeptidase family protein [Gammaproteobacteria bacterium]